VALTKQQAFPLYMFLCTDSNFRRTLQEKKSKDAATFLADLGALLATLDNTVTAPIDVGLAAVYGGVDATGTILSTTPQTIINAIRALSAHYGGGPCPVAGEEPALYKAIGGAV